MSSRSNSNLDSLKPDFILASASHRRQQLLTDMGATFAVVPADIDETPNPNESPGDYVLRIARTKAETVYARHCDSSLPVLGADTTVVAPANAVFGERIFGKPESEDEALAMLMALSGLTHRVLTAIALVIEDLNSDTECFQCHEQLVETKVTFRELSENECRRYWQSGEPRDKAGSYGIQGLGGIFVARIEGSYSSVVGLPLVETYTLLQTFNIACGIKGS